MKRLMPGLLIAALASPASGAATAAVPIQRFLLVVGANAGGGDRAKLRYAITDAERFARVMTELGGVAPANEIVLKQPKLRELIDALDQLTARVSAARRLKEAGRIEVVVYYSGHADEQGLLLGGERYAYRSLRERLDAIPADVRIAVLDACASGAFTRIKGGTLRPPFLIDGSANMRGHAFLTSSAATESAQESDRIRASYFTHYLVSGFRGAADLSGDGKVTLNEAYQFAFSETLGRTVDTRGGAQHPSYDINLSGTGDVVMTDVRQTSATITLGENLAGRIFVRSAAQNIVVELQKAYGRAIDLGVEPGAYEVRLDRDKTSLLATTKVDENAKVTLDARQFGATTLAATRQRGDGLASPSRAVAGRHRLDWFVNGAFPQGVTAARQSSASVIYGWRYTHYLREDLALTGAIAKGNGAVLGGTDQPGASVAADRMVSVPLGVRWYPSATRHPGLSVKPFVAGSVGPVFGSAGATFTTSGVPLTGARSVTTVTSHIGGGVDMHVARPVSIGVTGGYNWMVDFPKAAGAIDHFSGATFGVSLGFLFGKGR